jgi:hypothetical protein
VKKPADPLMSHIQCKHKGTAVVGPGPCFDCTMTHLLRKLGVQPNVIEGVFKTWFGESPGPSTIGPHMRQ